MQIYGTIIVIDFSELKDNLTLDADTTINTNSHSLNINGTLRTTSIIVSDSATIGMLGLNLYTNTSFIPSNSGLNLGSSSHHWANLYADNLAVGTLDVQNSNVSGTSSQYFTINSKAIGEDDMGIRFYRGSAQNGYAALAWNGANKNFNLFKKESSSTLADLNLGSLYTAGNVGVGTTSPGAKLDVVSGDGASARGSLIISGGRSLGTTVNGSAGSILFTNSYWNSGYGPAAIYGIMVVPFVNTAKLEKLEGNFLKIISY